MLSDINEVSRSGRREARVQTGRAYFPGLARSRMCLLGHMCLGAHVWCVPPRASCLLMKVLTANPAHLAADSPFSRPCVASTVFPSTEKLSFQPGGILFYLLSICWGPGEWRLRPHPRTHTVGVLGPRSVKSQYSHFSDEFQAVGGGEGLLANGFFIFKALDWWHFILMV